MTDGPHKTLPLPQRWKKVAELANDSASSREDLATGLRAALIKTWEQAVPRPLRERLLRVALGQLFLIDDSRSGDHSVLGAGEQGSQPAQLLAASLGSALESANTCAEAVSRAVGATLEETASRHLRQIEAHMLVKGERECFDLIRSRLEQVDSEFDYAGLADELVEAPDGVQAPKAAKRTGLDEGPRLP